MAGNIGFHPAPGLGDLLPGYFVVPQNPIDVGLSGIGYRRGIADILPGSFVVPQNPIVDFTNGQVKLIGQKSNVKGSLNGGKDCGCGCGGSGGCGGGMGDISSDLTQFTTDLTSGNFMGAISDPIMGIPAYGWALGLAAVYMFAFAPSTGASRVSRARKAYRTYASNPRRKGARRRRR